MANTLRSVFELTIEDMEFSLLDDFGRDFVDRVFGNLGELELEVVKSVDCRLSYELLVDLSRTLLDLFQCF